MAGVIKSSTSGAIHVCELARGDDEQTVEISTSVVSVEIGITQDGLDYVLFHVLDCVALRRYAWGWGEWMSCLSRSTRHAVSPVPVCTILAAAV